MTTAPRTPQALAKSLFTGEGALWRLAGATLLVSTLTAQHPNPLFSRLSRKDTFSMLPNWRFFAPIPATNDYHFLYRVLDADGITSPWRGLDVIENRKPWQVVWFPTRRSGKAIFDLCHEILHVIPRGLAVTARTPAYQMLTEYLRATLRAQDNSPHTVEGFQIALARATGYDTSQEPELVFISSYIPLDPHAPATSVPPAKTEAKT
jgi:hypothetical protein